IHAYESFLIKHKKEPGSARQSIQNFLELADDQEIAISSTPRIILVSPGFSREITTTVLWLNSQGLDIRCIEANLYTLDGTYYIDIDQVIPLPSANDYQVRIREKTIKAEREAFVKRRGRTLDIMIEHELLKEGTRLRLIYLPKPGLEITDDRARYATFNNTGIHGITWDYDGKSYSLSSLCKTICEMYGGDVGSGAFPGPDYWAIDGETQSLSQHASFLFKSR
ncbi:MAG: hypothetical protein ABIR47_00515, partial [Candidatus Kapaibacterium sp.]